MNDIILPLVTVIILVSGVIILGWLEENDMKSINKAFYKLNLRDPYAVIEYLNLIATKPLWRISLMTGILLALIATAIYCWSKCVQWHFYMASWIAIGYIVSISYLSFYSFHVITPNGTQETINKLQNMDGVCTQRWG